MERRHRRWLGPALRAGITLLALAWIVRTLEPRQAAAALAAAPWWAFAAPIALMMLNALLHAARIRVLLGGIGVHVSPWTALSAILQGHFAGLALPTGGGDVVKATVLTHATRRLDAVVATLAVARMLEILPWMVLLLYGLGWGLPEAYPLLGTSAATFAAVFAATLLIAVGVARFGDHLARRLPVGQGLALRLAGALRALSGAPRAVGLALLLVLPTAAANVTSVWILLHGYDVPMGFAEAAAVVPAADTVISLPVTIGGLGLREGVFVIFLEPWGVPQSTALAAAFTRWTGELTRAALGGVFFLASGRVLGLASPLAAADQGNGQRGEDERADSGPGG
jgi:glycosyltransferase 2 family protein